MLYQVKTDFFLHKPTGKICSIMKYIAPNNLASLRSDARKILRQIPAPEKGKPWANEYLPEPNAIERSYAERILALAEPAVEVWVQGTGSTFCSESDLEPIR